MTSVDDLAFLMGSMELVPAEGHGRCRAIAGSGFRCRRAVCQGDWLCSGHAGTGVDIYMGGDSDMSGGVAAEATTSHDGRCAGVCKGGSRCRKKALQGSAYCSVHGSREVESTVAMPPRPVVAKCEGMCRGGKRCKKKALSGSRFCATHRGQTAAIEAIQADSDTERPASSAATRHRGAGKCAGVCRDGRLCSRRVGKGKLFCPAHLKQA